ncbi:hypothetical protein VPHG_00041 [Vibrio phage 11895-B1]|uniref:hypothetical protein n=1 Tax=Vibrio phage 11895-B1 TaxID=754075 RepID=UPI0002C11B3C|nr:hypothetical protein VPHG_00041 [Vibrio phage 11895-B1]AGH32108.1 hypothetical protein VPHG_00041 [Vibrio phage 11895-B1]
MLNVLNNEYMQKWSYSGYTVVKATNSINYSVVNPYSKTVNVLNSLEDCRRFIDFLCCR